MSPRCKQARHELVAAVAYPPSRPQLAATLLENVMRRPSPTITPPLRQRRITADARPESNDPLRIGLGPCAEATRQRAQPMGAQHRRGRHSAVRSSEPLSEKWEAANERRVLAAVGRTMDSPLNSVDVATKGRWQQMQ